MKILGICGSLRKESYNLKLLKCFGEQLPSSVEYEIVTLHDIPLYNEDQEVIGFPSSVNMLADKVMKADILLFGSPEYNYSIPGVLKNAIDWVSRKKEKPFAKKRAAVMGASPGKLGAARAQYHLRQVAVFVDLRFINWPEVMVAEAHKKFDENGRLIHAPTAEFVKKLADVLVSGEAF